MPAPSADAPIGVFDSGVGGLTVLAALRERLPSQHFLYLGDTARLPYGTKSGESVVRYALQAADALVARGIAALVVACNTAASVALPAIRARYPGLPVIGVVEPGAEAACTATRREHVAVIATEGTIRGGAYQRAIAQRRPMVQVETVSCALFVALAEEGWTGGAVAEAVAHRYLDPLFARVDARQRPDVLVLGCTHFPLLREPIRTVVGPDVQIVDSAATTAAAVQFALQRPAAGGTAGAPGVAGVTGAAGADVDSAPGSMRFLATEGVARFARVGAAFLGIALAPDRVELVDL